MYFYGGSLAIEFSRLGVFFRLDYWSSGIEQS